MHAARRQLRMRAPATDPAIVLWDTCVLVYACQYRFAATQVHARYPISQVGSDVPLPSEGWSGSSGVVVLSFGVAVGFGTAGVVGIGAGVSIGSGSGSGSGIGATSSISVCESRHMTIGTAIDPPNDVYRASQESASQESERWQRHWRPARHVPRPPRLPIHRQS